MKKKTKKGKIDVKALVPEKRKDYGKNKERKVK